MYIFIFYKLCCLKMYVLILMMSMMYCLLPIELQAFPHLQLRKITFFDILDQPDHLS